MAGMDKDIEGEAIPMPGLKIGYLPQEPQLDPNETVREAVEQGMGERAGRQEALDEVYAAYAEPDADFDAGRRAGQTGGHHRRRRQREHRAPAGNRRRRAAPAALGRQDRQALRRREAPRGAVPPAAVQAPTCCCSTSPPTTWTPNRWTGWSSSCSASRAPWWPSPTTATSWTTPPSGSWNWTAATAFPTRATTADLAGAEGSAPGAGAEAQRGRPPRP
jgi:hypothetical protein